jgi:hypothetical protein
MRSVARHWRLSGFANTDLDLPLKKHAIHQPIASGAHACIEATVCFAAERGYHVTIVKDATADYPDGDMHASREVQCPELCHCYAHGKGDCCGDRIALAIEQPFALMSALGLKRVFSKMSALRQ